MKRLTRYFLQGLLFVAPIAVTGFVFYKLFMIMDAPVRNVIHSAFGIDIPGIGFLITVIVAAVVFTLVGLLSSNLLTRSFMELFDRQFARFPLIKLLHSSIKDLIGAFVGDKRTFDQPVLVTPFPGSDARLVGFVTRKTMDIWGMADHIAVYVPMSFNFGGNLLIVARDRVTPLNVAVSDAMAFVVSGGIAGKIPVAEPTVHTSQDK